MKRRSVFLLFLFAVLLAAGDSALALTEAAGAGAAPAFHSVLLILAAILVVAKVGGEVALRFRQPEVLGELLIGIIVGNVYLFGMRGGDLLQKNIVIHFLSELGVVLLLFEVGLEISVGEMRKVGFASLLVAMLGIIAPFALGWLVSSAFHPEISGLAHLFVGATLTATSVGITARVLKDLGKLRSGEGRIILGAAVIDDVLGLLVLAVVSGVITAANEGGAFGFVSVAKTAGIALGFLLLSLTMGRLLVARLFGLASYCRVSGLLLALSLTICFLFAALAWLAGLAPIVGAFTAGLILEPVHYRDLSLKHEEQELNTLLKPITSLLVPIFFVGMGATVDLTVFLDPQVVHFAFWLTVSGIVGKLVAGFAVLNRQALNRVAIGVGMIPRGEVGLIFASLGSTMLLHGKPVIDSQTNSALIVMVAVTTMVTPPLLRRSFARVSG